AAQSFPGEALEQRRGEPRGIDFENRFVSVPLVETGAEVTARLDGQRRERADVEADRFEEGGIRALDAARAQQDGESADANGGTRTEIDRAACEDAAPPCDDA